MREYGDALRELAAVNIFAGRPAVQEFRRDALRPRRVLRLRRDRVPDRLASFAAFRRRRPGFDEMAERRLVPVGPHDIVPGGVRDVPAHRRACANAFWRVTPICFEPEWWQATQAEIRTGSLVEVLSYSESRTLRAHGALTSDNTRRFTFSVERRGFAAAA